MRSRLWRSGRFAAAMAILLVPTGLAAQGDAGLDQARQIAEEFAKGSSKSKGTTAGFPLPVRTVEPSEAPGPEEEQRLVDEIDMLERARAEAEARRDVLVKEREAAEAAERTAGEGTVAKAEAKRRGEDAERQIAAERAKADDATRQTEEAKRKIDEIERRIEAERERAEAAVREAETVKRKVEEAEQRLQSERARAEAARRDADTQKRAEDERRLAEERERAAEALRIAEERRKSLEDAEQKRVAASFDAEARRLDDALRRVQEAREARMRERPAASRDGRHEETASMLPPSPPREASSASREEGQGQSSEPREVSFERPSVELRDGVKDRSRHGERHATRVAILLVLEIGNRGIRRTNKSADPVLCGERGCYVSTGVDSAAELLPMRRALGAGRTLGSRAGACSNSPGCVFRDVDLVAFPAIVQPVDMRFLKHDRRQPQALHETSECELIAGRLTCSGVQGPNYTMWIVPEELARAAGAAELERVVDAGLPSVPGRH